MRPSSGWTNPAGLIEAWAHSASDSARGKRPGKNRRSVTMLMTLQSDSRDRDQMFDGDLITLEFDTVHRTLPRRPGLF